MRAAGALRRLFVDPPDESLLQTGGVGELIIARARAGLTGVLLVMATLSYFQNPGSLQSRIHFAGGLIAVPLSLLVLFWIRRAHYAWWIGFSTTLLDVTMVSAALAAFLVADNPIAALNNHMVFPIYFLALAATTMRLDHRACALAGVTAVVQYSIIVWAAVTWWEVTAAGYAVADYGRVELGSQLGRVVILAAAGALGTVVNLRMQTPHILSAADWLTGLMNRRAFDERWQGEVARARRYGRPISILAIDIDYFKQFNDTYGHAAGDTALQSVGRVIRSRIRAGDFAGRLGGEEFVIALPETNSVNAMTMAEQLRDGIARNAIRIGGQRGTVRVTISVGVASWPEHGEEITRLFERADNRLYEAKLAGRDQVKGPGAEAGGRAAMRLPPRMRVRPG